MADELWPRGRPAAVRRILNTTTDRDRRRPPAAARTVFLLCLVALASPGRPICSGQGTSTRTISVNAAANNRANQMNPNNPAHRPLHRQTASKITGLNEVQQLTNNRANVKNPNHPAFYGSRGKPPPRGEDLQRAATNAARKRKDEGHFEWKSHNVASKTGVDGAAVEAFTRCVRRVCGGDAVLKKTGSMKKGTDIGSSDFDYHLLTKNPISMSQRDDIMRCSKERGLDISCGKKAFKVLTPAGKIDFFPRRAAWHPRDVNVTKPDRKAPGEQNAIRMLKQHCEKEGIDKKGFQLEKLIRQVGEEKGWNQKTDASGMMRFQEAQRRLHSDPST